MARSAFLHPFTRPAATEFITMVRGVGARVYDAGGTEYIDALASLWYCQVGHGRAEIADAVDRQLRLLGGFHTFELFTNEPAEQFCAEVAAIAPMPGARVFLTNSGSEAVDTAIKLSRLWWSWQGQPDRTLVVSRDRGYHGVTYGGTSAQGLPLNKEHWGPLLADVEQVDADDLSDIQARFAEHGDRIAAVIAEPLQGAAGVHPPTPGYLQGLRDLCHRHGALLIFDEVVTGFGRLGTWWGAEHFGVTPDLLTFAKGASSGYQPLGGVVMGRTVLDVLEADDTRWLRHGFTYSGHPATCAAGVANLAVLRDEDLLARASHIGTRLEPGLRSIVADGLGAGVRGAEGIWALVLSPGVPAFDVRDAMLRRGVIARPIGADTVAFCPPLVITDDELDRILTVTRDAVVAVSSGAA